MAIPKSKIEKAVQRAFPNAKILNVKKAVKGLINITYKIKISNPKKELMLRLFPHENWKAKKENYLYKLIGQKTKVPVPEVYDVECNKNALPYPYLLMEKINGRPLGEFRKVDSRLVEKAGMHLAEIHRIKMPYFGWLVDTHINPVFKKWKDFFLFDTNFKFRKAAETGKLSKSDCERIAKIIEKNKNLLEINDKPCLLHKDFHQAHIFTDGKKITGIIDLEWAIAGHNEMDLAKTKWRMFSLYPEWEKPFMKGYLKFGKISKDFEKREKLYRLNLLLSSISLAHQTKNNKWMSNSLRWLKGLLKEF